MKNENLLHKWGLVETQLLCTVNFFLFQVVEEKFNKSSRCSFHRADILCIALVYMSVSLLTCRKLVNGGAIAPPVPLPLKSMEVLNFDTIFLNLMETKFKKWYKFDNFGTSGLHIAFMRTDSRDLFSH